MSVKKTNNVNKGAWLFYPIIIVLYMDCSKSRNKTLARILIYVQG